jgi:SAM-dependent methyltransferase
MANAGSYQDVSRYYDFIYLWSQLTNGFRAFSANDAYTIHRPLTDPESGHFSTDTIHQLIAQAVSRLGEVDALEAGCGYGGSCLDLHGRLGGRWHGITINERQRRIAERTAAAMGKQDAVTFALASYDDRPQRTFNMVYAVESLIHSSAPHKTIANLASCLRPGGAMIIVDDMPAVPLRPEYDQSLASFKAMWRCPVMPTAPQWCAHLEQAGCQIDEVQDLTALMGPRSEAEIARELCTLTRRRRWRDRLGLRMVTDAQIGGLLLERLTRERAVLYTMIVARKV